MTMATLKIVLGDGSFLEAIKSSHTNDSMFSKILENPGQYLNFRVFEGIIHTRTVLVMNAYAYYTRTSFGQGAILHHCWLSSPHLWNHEVFDPSPLMPS